MPLAAVSQAVLACLAQLLVIPYHPPNVLLCVWVFFSVTDFSLLALLGLCWIL